MDARLREGIGLFNERRFFECHEVLEALYQETEAANKPFIEGLIQLAAAFRIFCEFGEVKGPVRMIYQALVRFENYQPDFLQVRVSEAAAAMETWAKQAERGANAPPPSSVPKIPLQRSGFFS
jgi:predicted metal-dependent hydrolase